jgi:hypothetical protein
MFIDFTQKNAMYLFNYRFPDSCTKAMVVCWYLSSHEGQGEKIDKRHRPALCSDHPIAVPLKTWSDGTGDLGYPLP